MGQKVHPIGIRLGNTRRAHSCWYKPKRYYAYFIQEDQRIREIISRISSQSKQTDISNKRIPPVITEILIDRRDRIFRIRILGSRLDFLTDRNNLEDLRAKLTEEITKYRQDFFWNLSSGISIKRGSKFDTRAFRNPLDQQTPIHFQIFIREMHYPEISALYQASLIVEELQKRTPFRRAMRLRTVQASRVRAIQGIRIQISGRLGGAEIARTEWTREGQVPLHTICAHLDYSSCTAATIYGSLGVKVWIFT